MINEIFLGIVQGVTEWLPISSQGQIVFLAINFLGLSSEKLMEKVLLLHLGTAMSALVYFWKEILEVLKDKEKVVFYLFALLGSLISGLPLYFVIDSFIGNIWIINLIIGFGLLVTGFVLKSRGKGKEDFSFGNGFLLGLVQGCAVVPGLSRSGLSAGYLLFRGFKPESAFKVSFILAIPSILGAMILMGLKNEFVLGIDVFLGLLTAFIVGYLLIDVILRVAKKFNFSKICYLLGGLYLLITFLEFFVLL